MAMARAKRATGRFIQAEPGTGHGSNGNDGWFQTPPAASPRHLATDRRASRFQNRAQASARTR
jgi:hypothetical protein